MRDADLLVANIDWKLMQKSPFMVQGEQAVATIYDCSQEKYTGNCLCPNETYRVCLDKIIFLLWSLPPRILSICTSIFTTDDGVVSFSRLRCLPGSLSSMRRVRFVINVF